MTITIDLTPEEEARLSASAARLGLEPGEYLRKCIPIEPTNADVGPRRVIDAR